MHSKEVIVRNKLGLHARAAAMFVQLAHNFKSDIFIEKNGEVMNGKSIMGIMMLAASKGTKLVLKADGEDAETALLALEKLIKDKFNEE